MTIPIMIQEAARLGRLITKGERLRLYNELEGILISDVKLRGAMYYPGYEATFQGMTYSVNKEYTGDSSEREPVIHRNKRKFIPQGTNNNLHASLYSQMATFNSDYDKLELFLKAFLQYFRTQVVKSRDSLQELRNRLPECVVQLSPVLNCLSRTKDATEYANLSPSTLRSFEKIQDEIRAHIAMQYLI